MELQKPLKQKTLLLLGSKPSSLPFIKIDERIITSTEALKLPEVPKHLVSLVVELLVLS
jgi:dihydrolipoamide dehydrogenase